MEMMKSGCASASCNIPDMSCYAVVGRRLLGSSSSVPCIAIIFKHLIEDLLQSKTAINRSNKIKKECINDDVALCRNRQLLLNTLVTVICVDRNVFILVIQTKNQTKSLAELRHLLKP